MAATVAIPQYYGSPAYTGVWTYEQGARESLARRGALPYLSGFNANSEQLKGVLGPLSEDSKLLISAGAPRLAQATAKLNELADQLPAALKNIDPNTSSDILKVNGIISDVCQKAVAETKPTAYTRNATPQGMQAMCDYIRSIGNDILMGLQNPDIFKKYTADLNKAIIALNGKAADLTL